jgi:hypothetical protein
MSGMGECKILKIGTEHFSSIGGIEKVSLKGPEDFSDMGIFKNSQARDRKTFPAWAREKQATARTSCCNIMMQDRKEQLIFNLRKQYLKTQCGIISYLFCRYTKCQYCSVFFLFLLKWRRKVSFM